MKKLIGGALLLLCLPALAADEINISVTMPAKELVTSIHEFCIDQHSIQDEPDLEGYLLRCVNHDLKISAYQTFQSYEKLSTFIEDKRGEE